MPKHTHCTEDDCTRPGAYRDMCRMHYARAKKAGTLPPRKSTAERFWEKVNKAGPEYTDLGRCWEWTAVTSDNGYGLFRFEGAVARAHRWSYEQAHGTISDGHDIDHICGNRACVNPGHLRDATRKQNMENYTVRHRRNKTGYRGVYKQGNSYIAQVSHHGYTTHLGSFSTAAEAGESARKARIELFTHNDRDQAA